MLGGGGQIVLIDPGAGIQGGAVGLLLLAGDGEGLQVEAAKDNRRHAQHIPHVEGSLAHRKHLAHQAGQLEDVLFLQAGEQRLEHRLLAGGPHVVAVQVADAGIGHRLVAVEVVLAVLIGAVDKVNLPVDIGDKVRGHHGAGGLLAEVPQVLV